MSSWYILETVNKNLLMGVAVVLVVGGLGVWYLGRNPKTEILNSKDVVESTPAPTPGPTVESLGEVKEFVVNGNDFKFDVTEIRVKVGDKVKVTFKNTGGFHDWVLDEFNVKTAQLKDGAEETVEFVAEKAGTFEYYCSVGKHRQMGMVGKLIVE